MHSATQSELPLTPRYRWGGRRAGAGRKPSHDSGLPHLMREPVAAAHPCLVTLKVRKDVPSLRSGKLVREFERSLRETCSGDRFRVAHYSIQRDHVHLIVEAAGRGALGRGMKSIGSRLARAVNRIFHRKGPVLRDRYHLRVLRSPRQVRNALAYVLQNARRHLAKRGGRMPAVSKPDPASSGRWFRGWRERVEEARDPPAVAQARTWLLVRGWRRHRRISLEEVPGRRKDGRRSATRRDGAS